MSDRQAFLLVPCGRHEIEQRQPLAFHIAADDSSIRLNGWRLHRACGTAHRCTEIGACQVFKDLLECPKGKHLVLDNGPSHRTAELLTVEVLQGFSVGSVGGESLEALVVEQGSMQLIGS